MKNICDIKELYGDQLIRIECIMITLRDCWAKTKPFQSIVTHAKISGMIAQYIYWKYLSAGDRTMLCRWLHAADEELAAFVGYLISLHDIGKIEEQFQEKWPEMAERLNEYGIYTSYAMRSNVRHEMTGFYILKQLWKKQNLDSRSKDVFSKIVRAHHQGKQGREGNWNESNWVNLQEQLECAMRNIFLDSIERDRDINKANIPTIEDGAMSGRISALLLGIMILADWIASGIAFSDAEEWIAKDNAKECIEIRVKEFFQKSQLEPIHKTWESLFCSVWPNIPSYGMRPLQVEIENLLRNNKERFQVILLEAPMGEGKTEAGLYAAIQMLRAWKKDGFYVALPTAATSNQMIGRMQEMLQENNIDCKVRLLHAMAWLSDTEEMVSINAENENEEIVKWLEPVRRGILGQYAVGTIDQAMLAATQVKYGVLRLLGLSNKALIIDEIHSYDVYMMEIIILLLKWCKALEVPVIMLSATLPPDLKAKLLKPYTEEPITQCYPAITAVKEDGTPVVRQIDRSVKNQIVTIKLEPILDEIEKIAELAVKQVKSGGCICVLMNTVKEAQAVYQAIRNKYTGELLLFHARFPAKQRMSIETTCIKKFGKDKTYRPKQAILVATQVVEQSLDVDFDQMITAVAPIDLLIQRMGRIFRHQETPRPENMQKPVQYVLIPRDGQKFGSTEVIYPPCLLRQTVRLLNQQRTIKIPEDLARLVADGYDEKLVPAEELDDWIAQKKEDGGEASKSNYCKLSTPDKEFTPCGGVDRILEDDENRGFLAVQTRLGEPTVRIALLEEELFHKIQTTPHKRKGNVIAEVIDSTLAKAVMEQSVSVREKELKRIKNYNSYAITGAMLLSGVKIFPAENGIFQCPDGGCIAFDAELGVMMKVGE